MFLAKKKDIYIYISNHDWLNDLKSIAVCLYDQELYEELKAQINCFVGSEKRDFQRHRIQVEKKWIYLKLLHNLT